jgi:crotonobetaine/carnitine-CoA ligase
MRIIDLPFESRAMPNLLRDQSLNIPDTPWLLFEDNLFTFAEADGIVDSYARGLAEMGVERGTNVGVMMENGPENLWVTMAIGRLGAVFVPVNTAYKSTFLSHVLGQAAVRLLVVDDAWADRLAGVESQLPDLKHVVVFGAKKPLLKAAVHDFGELVIPGTDRLECPVRSVDMMAILYTSGTTGPSKGAMMSHNYWYEATMSLNDRRDVRSDDCFYLSSPMFHVAAWVTHIFPAMALGLPVALDRKFSVSDFWKRVRHYKGTQLFTIAAQTLWLLNAPQREDDADNPARVWAPVPLAHELHDVLKRRFGIEHLWNTYGQTEAMCITCTDTRRPYKPGSAGWPRREVEIAILDEYDRKLPPNNVGEIAVRSRTPYSIMDGYWKSPEASLEAFRNLWYHTGDLGRMDEDGEVFFVDRKKDYLRIRGENISSFQVESVIASHPAVAEVAAFLIRPAERADEELKI